MRVADWCDDCCYEWPSKHGYTQLHRHPCDCVCHHPSRLVAAARPVPTEPAATGMVVYPEDA